MSRYRSDRVITNNFEAFREQFEKRDCNRIDHYVTKRLIYPSRKEEQSLDYYKYIWKRQDKYYQIASQYYNDPTLWWVIAQYNNKPTEQHIAEGEEIKIPYPIGRVLQIMSQ